MSTQSTPFLTYSVISDPNPPATGENATLTLAVSNTLNQLVIVTKIVFNIPTGLDTDATALTSDAGAISSGAPDDWTITASGGQFTITPNTAAASAIGLQGISFTFANIPVNSSVGTASLSIYETATYSDESTNNALETIPISKFPPTFSISYFKATPQIVEPGDQTILSWEVTAGASYKIQYGTTVVDGLPATGNYTVQSIQNDTVFYLIVNASENGQPIESHAETIVTVNRPEILSFYSNFDIVYRGESAALHWETNSATTGCTLKIDGVPQPSQPANSPADGFSVTPDSNTGNDFYELTANGASSHSQSQTVQIFAKTLNLSEMSSAPPGAAAIAYNKTKGLVFIANAHTSSVEVTDFSSLSAAENGLGGTVISTIPVGVLPRGLALSPDGNTLYCANGASQSISVIDVDSLTVTDTIDNIPDPYGITLFGAATAYVSNFGSNTVSIVDLSGKSISGTISCGNAPTGVALTPDGVNAFVGNYNDSTISVVDLSTGTVASTISVPDLPLGLTTSGNGASVYAVCRTSQDIQVIDTAEKSVLTTVGMFMAPNGIAVSQDGTVALALGGLGIFSYDFKN